MATDRHLAYIMYVPDYVPRVEKRITLITASIAINRPRARVRYKNQKKEKLEKIRKNERY